MSYVCDKCKKPQESGIKLNKVVVETRKVIYPVVKDNNGKIIKTPQGYETVKELNVCPECSTLNFETAIVGEKVLY